MANGRGGAPSVTRRKYMLQLLGERLTGEVAESYSNHHMERGKVMEEEARDLFAFQTGSMLTRVGFVLNDELGIGCSPDALIGEDGGLELKTCLPHIQLERLLTGKNCPAEHVAQVQGSMWVTGRKYWEFASHWTKLPQYRVRVERDEVYIATLAAAVKAFNEELLALQSRFAEAA